MKTHLKMLGLAIRIVLGSIALITLLLIAFLLFWYYGHEYSNFMHNLTF